MDVYTTIGVLIALAALFQKFQRVKKGRAEASDTAS